MTFADEEALMSHMSKLMSGEETDFVAYPVISHWHAVGVDALACAISSSKKETTSGIVVIVPHRTAGFLISERDFMCQSFATIRFLYFDVWLGYRTEERITWRLKEMFRSKWQTLVAARKMARRNGSHKMTLHVVSPRNPNTSFLRFIARSPLADRYHLIFLLLDEGLGSYMPGSIWNLNLKAHEASAMRSKAMDEFRLVSVWLKSVLLVRQLLAVVATKVAYLLFEVVMERETMRHMVIEKPSVFRKERGRLVANANVVEWYREVIKERSNAHVRPERRGPLAIVVTQPFAEYGRISLSGELGVTGGVIGVLVQMGFDVLLKPHPRETKDKYASALSEFKPDRVKLWSQSTPVEELLPVLQPACVVGYTSTALPVASSLYRIPAITIVDILLHKTRDEYMRLHAKKFRRLTAEICHHANSFDEFGGILASVVLHRAAT